jgi:hypothetical protein
MKSKLIGKVTQSDNQLLNNTTFAIGVKEIRKYSLKINTVNLKKKKKEEVKEIKDRTFIIELHLYNGFGMIKFYPRHLKDNPNKYKMRAKSLGYSMRLREVKEILWETAELMKTYLDEFPNNFMGYVGQPDDKDDLESRRRTISQRASIYNTLVASVFKIPKYNLSAPDLYKAINLKLIRRITDKNKEYSLSDTQKSNYKNMLKVLESNPTILYDLMTDETRKIIKSGNQI